MESTATRFSLARAIGPTVRARALVSTVPFSARYDLDRVNGVVSRIDHPLRGSSITDRLFIAPGVQGGVAGGWALMAMAKRGIGFAGLILGDTNPVMVQGAVTAGIPIAAGFDVELLETVRTGDLIELDPEQRTLRIIERLRS
ncbi:DUF126 domain-containing protein [Leucobacter sp. CSA1]|uniref:DUF126 domain-containing protein n=1 Tax=Leucobacter chromiisoli TaxID=2796471 RepID=A0A934Q932_9MICO|nr:DUF126 domain-containing protein [Leucobacter chromiisoli]MBK0419067.1 DUF126 domain-containing protein [Leucobacter chromiisoli]